MVSGNEMTGASLLVYDIPDKAGYALPNGKWRRMPNPSYRLRSFATRINKSVWVVPDAGIDAANKVIERLRRGKGVEVEIVRFSERERGKVIRLARRGLEREVKRIRKYLDKAIAKAQKTLDDSVRSMSVAGVGKAIDYRKGALGRARRELLAAKESSIAFDILGDMQELHDSVVTLWKGQETLKFGVEEEQRITTAAAEAAEAAKRQAAQDALDVLRTGGTSAGA